MKESSEGHTVGAPWDFSEGHTVDTLWAVLGRFVTAAPEAWKALKEDLRADADDGARMYKDGEDHPHVVFLRSQVRVMEDREQDFWGAADGQVVHAPQNIDRLIRDRERENDNKARDLKLKLKRVESLLMGGYCTSGRVALSSLMQDRKYFPE